LLGWAGYWSWLDGPPCLCRCLSYPSRFCFDDDAVCVVAAYWTCVKVQIGLLM
jgi:hypothetical protein